MKTKAVHVISLIRVSSLQQEGNNSPTAQRNSITDYVSNAGWEISEELEYIESGSNGSKKENLTKCLNKVRKLRRLNKTLRIVIILDRADRLSRDVVDAKAFSDIYRKGIAEFILIRENIHLTENSNKFQIHQFHAVLTESEGYSATLSKNIKDTQSKKLKEGAYPGGAKIGYINEKDQRGRTIRTKLDPVRSRFVKRAFTLFAEENHNFKSIAELLAKEGFTTNIKYARHNFIEQPVTEETIARIIRNPLYKGLIDFAGQKAPFLAAEPIVGIDLWDKANSKAEQISNKKYKHKAKKFILKGTLRCGKCKRFMTGDIKKKKIPVYFCSYCKNIRKTGTRYPSESKIMNKVIKELNKLPLKQHAADISLAVDEFKRSSYSDAVHDIEAKVTRNNEMITKLKKELLNLKILSSDAEMILSQEDIDNRIKEIIMKIENLTNSNTLFRSQLENNYLYPVNHIHEVLVNFMDYFGEGTIEEKESMIKIIFDQIKF